MSTINPFSQPLYVMAKPIGASCNLRCDYCYYLEKSKYYEDSKNTLMSDALLEEYIRQYMESHITGQALFVWHGGEPLLRPVSFYRKIIALQKKYAKGRKFDNSIQTNGLLLNEEWCRFFKDNGWLVGLSIDGPEKLHNKYRLRANGKPTFSGVMRGVELLKRYDVEWNALAVVNNYNADYPLDFYRFFKEIECRFIQFTPVSDRIDPYTDHRLAPFSVSPKQWGNFLCTIFDEWVRNDVGKYFIQIFDATLANWMGVQPGICTLASTCGHAGVMEHNGDVYVCDHFVYPEYKLGNIKDKTLIEMMYSPEAIEFGNAKQNSLPRQCRECKYLFACNGECPRNRFITTEDGEPGLNYLCKGYYQFFNYVAPAMEFMKRELLNRRPASNIMKVLNNA